MLKDGQSGIASGNGCCAILRCDLSGAACTADGNGITYNKNINVALAVAMPDGGLITPVIKDADVTDIYQVSQRSRFLRCSVAAP